MIFSDLNQNEIIALTTEALQVVLKDNLPVRIFIETNEKNYATPRVMRHLEQVFTKGSNLIDRVALVGLNPSKKLILKGFNLLVNRDLKTFDTREEAIEFLIQVNPVKAP